MLALLPLCCDIPRADPGARPDAIREAISLGLAWQRCRRRRASVSGADGAVCTLPLARQRARPGWSPPLRQRVPCRRSAATGTPAKPVLRAAGLAQGGKRKRHPGQAGRGARRRRSPSVLCPRGLTHTRRAAMHIRARERVTAQLSRPTAPRAEWRPPSKGRTPRRRRQVLLLPFCAAAACGAPVRTRALVAPVIG